MFQNKNKKDSNVASAITESEPVAAGKDMDKVIKCPKCGKMVNRHKVVKNKYICYECNSYFRVKTKNRIRMVADPGTFENWYDDIEDCNPLGYEGYEQKLAEAKERTGLHEAVTVGTCKIFGEQAVIGVCDSRFMMASMGHVVEKRSRERLRERLSSDSLSFCSAAPAVPECRRVSYP